MRTDSKLMVMLTGYAAAHRHPFNVAVHLLGIPVIMFGVFIPLSWVSFEVTEFHFDLAQVTVIGLFLYYLTLDAVFALVFLVGGLGVAAAASRIGLPASAMAGGIAAAAFFGGYALQFIGHAVEKSAPVILKHPIQANLAAPFFTIVEVFGLLGLRKALFEAVQAAIAEQQENKARVS